MRNLSDVKSISVVAKEWFDKVNGNSYFSARIEVEMKNNVVGKMISDSFNKAKQPDNFERKQGKKSLLSRFFTGNSSQELRNSVEKFGLDYETENQEKAQQKANDFVESVGALNALEAVRKNMIKGAEKAFVYQKIADAIVTGKQIGRAHV